MEIWNVWTALMTGLLIGTNFGILLTALLVINKRCETPRPILRNKKVDRLDPSVLHKDDSATPPNTPENTAEPREPAHFH